MGLFDFLFPPKKVFVSPEPEPFENFVAELKKFEKIFFPFTLHTENTTIENNRKCSKLFNGFDNYRLASKRYKGLFEIVDEKPSKDWGVFIDFSWIDKGTNISCYTQHSYLNSKKGSLFFLDGYFTLFTISLEFENIMNSPKPFGIAPEFTEDFFIENIKKEIGISNPATVQSYRLRFTGKIVPQ